MRWLRDLGLGVKLSALLLLVLGILLLLTAFLLITNTQDLNKEVGTERITEQTVLVQQRMAEAERELAVDVNFISSSVAFFQAVGRRSVDAVTEIVTQTQQQLGFDDVDVIDGDGSVLADYGVEAEESELYELLNATLTQGAGTYIIVAEDAGELTVRFTAMAPVISATGNVLGAIQISRYIDSDFLSQLFFDPTGVFAGLIYEGQFVARTNNVVPSEVTPTSLEHDIEFSPDEVARAVTGETIILNNLIFSDVPHAVAYVPLTANDQISPAVMMILFELDEIYAFQNATLVNTIVSFALLTVLAIAFIYLAVYRFALRPISNLRATADKMIAGEYDQRIVVTGQDELGKLALTFNEMALAVQQREISLQAAREQAERSDQVKSAFLASMSHELRTPLNAVLNFTQFVIDGDTGPVNEFQVELLSQVVGSGKHLLNLINDVLDMSKIEAGSLKLFIEDNIDVNKILNNVIATGHGLLNGKPVEIRADIAPELPLIRADGQRILQIFLNIMSNACKFTNSGTIKVGAELKDGSLIVAISDTGPGIAPEDHAVVFEAFKQTKTGLLQGGGTGLGMPIARSLAEAHGGKLWLSSDIGKGSTFYVSLPVESRQLVPTLTLEGMVQ